jgi:hypothetical protein
MPEFRNDSNLTTSDLVNPGRTAVIDRDPPPASVSSRLDDQRPAAPIPLPSSMPDIPANPPASAMAVEKDRVTGHIAAAGALFPDDELHNFRARWDGIQTSFVDEPRKAVEEADSLVANVVKRIAEQFANERAQLEKQWDRGDEMNTEDLRQAFKRYRAFFDRLLSF